MAHSAFCKMHALLSGGISRKVCLSQYDDVSDGRRVEDIAGRVVGRTKESTRQTKTPPASVSMVVQVFLPEALYDVQKYSSADLANQKKTPRSYKLHPGCSYRDAATL